MKKSEEKHFVENIIRCCDDFLKTHEAFMQLVEQDPSAPTKKNLSVIYSHASGSLPCLLDNPEEVMKTAPKLEDVHSTTTQNGQHYIISNIFQAHSPQSVEITETVRNFFSPFEKAVVAERNNLRNRLQTLKR